MYNESHVLNEYISFTQLECVCVCVHLYEKQMYCKHMSQPCGLNVLFNLVLTPIKFVLSLDSLGLFRIVIVIHQHLFIVALLFFYCFDWYNTQFICMQSKFSMPQSSIEQSMKSLVEFLLHWPTNFIYLQNAFFLFAQQ